jgi:PrtD family type I secretion system ABC transporter
MGLGAWSPAEIGRMAKSNVKGENVLRTALKACRRHFVSVAVFSALLNLLYLAPTLYMLQVYDRVVPTRGVLTLIFLTLIFLFATAVLTGLDAVRTRLLVRASSRLDRRVSPEITSAVISRAGSSLRVNQAMREFDNLRQTITGIGILALFDAPWTPIYILICFLLHPALGAMALGGSASLVLLAWLNERTTTKPLKQANEAAAKAYNSLDQSITIGPVLRALGMRRAMIARHMRERHESIHLQAVASFEASTYVTLTKFTRLSLQSISLGLGAYLAIEGKISAGSIFAASLLISRALAPIEQVLGAWKSVAQGRVAYQSLYELFEEADLGERRTRLPKPTGALAVENVSVLSPGRDRLILNGINFALDAGDALGVVGASGAGKSTLAKIIAGAMTPEQGRVRLDGADLKDWDEDQLALHLGYVPQEPSLLMGTIKDNISRFQTNLPNDPAAIDAAVVKAAQACGAHEMILRLPSGYDTPLGWNGSGLSAGQAQRIALARGLYGDPSLLILDEPNAHLDADGESELLRGLILLKEQGVTVVIIAHRTSVLAAIDKLMIMRDGRIEMFGPRDEVTQRLAAQRPATALNPAPQSGANPDAKETAA